MQENESDQVIQPHNKVCIVIPVFNEELLIDSVIDSIPLWVDKIFVIDDASTDRSASVIEKSIDPRVIFLHHEFNLGVGAAIVTGYQAAKKDQCQIAVVMGGDGQMDPNDLPALIAPILSSQADYVKGNRFDHYQTQHAMPLLRRIGNRLLTRLTRWAGHCSNIHDTQCGYTAIRLDILDRIDPGSLYPRFGFPNDLLIKLLGSGSRIMEVPVRAIYGTEKSKIRALKDIPQIFRLLIRHRILRTNPPGQNTPATGRSARQNGRLPTG